MDAKQALQGFLGLGLITLSYASSHATQCSYELPPNEQITLHGNDYASKTLDCKVEQAGEGSDFLMDFVSETNTSVVNSLIMPEGTMMSISFASMNNNELKFKLKPKAILGITNDSTDFIRLKCLKS